MQVFTAQGQPISLHGAPKILASGHHPALEQAVADCLGWPLVPAQMGAFRDGERQVDIQADVRDTDLFLLGTICPPAIDAGLMQLLVMLDAAKRASAQRMTAVLPYFPYARQDRKTSARSPITASLMANLLQTAGAHRVLTMDLHAAQMQGFFNVPVDDLRAAPVLLNDIRARYDLEKLTVASTDVGGVTRARSLARALNVPIAIIDKRRVQAGAVEEMTLIGEVAGKNVLMLDDLVDSGGTLAKAAQTFMEAGAQHVSAYATHGVFSGPAAANIAQSALTELVVTNTLPLPPAVAATGKVRQIDIAPHIAEAIHRLSNGHSISELYAEGYTPTLAQGQGQGRAVVWGDPTL